MRPASLRILALGLLTWLVALSLPAQDSLPYEQRQDLVYGEVHGTGLLMDVFLPKAGSNGLAVVDVVSGAWHSDRAKIRDHTMAQVYAVLCRHGYTVFALRPGSITRYTAAEMAQHLRTGIRFVKHRAAGYRIDPARLGLTGASAGGHLAALVAVTPQDGQPNARKPEDQHDTRVKAVALFFPPADFLDWNGQPAPKEILGRLLFLEGTTAPDEAGFERRARAASPARLVKGTPPPFLIFHGDADPLVPLQQSKALVEALKAAGGSAELVVKPGGGHPWFTIFEEVEVMAKWFDRQLVERQGGGTEKPAATEAK